MRQNGGYGAARGRCLMRGLSRCSRRNRRSGSLEYQGVLVVRGFRHLKPEEPDARRHWAITADEEVVGLIGLRVLNGG
jgi:hypothetical protein